jgi:uncharacterized protein (AIM24 family)
MNAMSAVAFLAMATASPGVLAATPNVRHGIRFGKAPPSEGNGEKTTQQRPVSGFTSLRVGGPIEVIVHEGPPHAVAVTIDSNLHGRVETRVEGDVLVIEVNGPIRYEGEGRVHVALPRLAGVAVPLQGLVVVNAAQSAREVTLSVGGEAELAWAGGAGRIALANSGVGAVTMSGTCARLSVALAGKGDVRAKDLSARDAEVTLTGAGNVELTLAGGALAVRLVGSGDVVWWGEGTPKATIAGSGHLVHR